MELETVFDDIMTLDRLGQIDLASKTLKSEISTALQEGRFQETNEFLGSFLVKRYPIHVTVQSTPLNLLLDLLAETLPYKKHLPIREEFFTEVSGVIWCCSLSHREFLKEFH